MIDIGGRGRWGRIEKREFLDNKRKFKLDKFDKNKVFFFRRVARGRVETGKDI